jgi:hypothetical protein
MKWLIAIIAVEGLTEILLHSALFEKPRAWLSRRGFFGKLFKCGWCLSLWVGLFVFGIILLRAEIVLIPIVFHRISNYIHAIYSFVKYARRP